MFTFPIFGRRNGRPKTRRRQVCRSTPLVETLEGRQLLSGVGPIQGNHIGMVLSAAIVGNHIGTNVSAAVQGAHIGTNVA